MGSLVRTDCSRYSDFVYIWVGLNSFVQLKIIYKKTHLAIGQIVWNF